MNIWNLLICDGDTFTHRPIHFFCLHETPKMRGWNVETVFLESLTVFLEGRQFSETHIDAPDFRISENTISCQPIRHLLQWVLTRPDKLKEIF